MCTDKAAPLAAAPVHFSKMKCTKFPSLSVRLSVRVCMHNKPQSMMITIKKSATIKHSCRTLLSTNIDNCKKTLIEYDYAKIEKRYKKTHLQQTKSRKVAFGLINGTETK